MPVSGFNRFSIKLLSTFFYTGCFPLAPGTFASLVALFIYLSIRNNAAVQIGIILLLLVLGFFVCSRAEEVFNKKDPPYIVIDEVAGMFLSLLFIGYSFKLVFIGFFLFRLFDTLKVFPAARIERVGGAIGIMGDDIIAGLYANALLHLLLRVAPSIAS
ncbi:MAG: phosphatidylglycerophosphatase A [Candidatus Omnitrophota bacterium]|jgi:phosphatidylglycerophosphatase A|nr:MAG: phosphatidylglycerophosphatase A [Candidatus Omnitrophota bacterium]